MLEIIIQTDNIYVLNVISYRKEEFIIDTDKLVDRLIKYEADYNWYDLVDDYGNIEVDEDALKKYFARYDELVELRIPAE